MGRIKQNKLIDLSLMCKDQKEYYDALDEEGKLEFLGFNGRARTNFDSPSFNSLPGRETVYNSGEANNPGNAWIVLGLDRPNLESSGFGGSNATHCAAVDIVAGRAAGAKGAWKTAQKVMIDGECQPYRVDSNFKLDAARIYVSQMADVDTYFQLKPGNVGNTNREEPRSCVAMKADTVRLIARENIKLVTRTDEQNSQGGRLGDALTSGYGIDLVACNDVATLQPMVKGENLRVFLEILVKVIQDLASTMGTYVKETRKLHSALIRHTHISPFYGTKTAPDFDGTMTDGLNVLINNVTKVDTGQMSLNAALNQIIFEYLSSPGAETVDKDGLPYNILSPYNSNN
jgi:hypothetical protein